jgi:GH15 family glucan-1,4-alpha-glucosidase
VPDLAEYALLGDSQTAALVGMDGSIDWWAPPRFDSASVLTRLLDPDAGHFAVRPAQPHETTRRYLDGTMVLETEHRTTSGATLRVTDALALEPGARGHEIGLRSPHAIVRVAEAVDGPVDVALELQAGFEYGLVVPRLQRDDERVHSVGGPARLVLSGAPDDVALDGADARGTVHLEPGQRHGFVLQWAPHPSGPPPTPLEPLATLADTITAWRSWNDQHDGFDGEYGDQVDRAALVLQALTYQPSGAVIAAATTSVPERLGGTANWDYRYAWLRDASLIARSLLQANCADEAERYFQWVARSALTPRDASHMQIVYAVGGERVLEETALDHLRGFADSRPVHIGNAAWRQQQLDVLGEVLDVAAALDEGPGLDLDAYTRAFLCDLADRALDQWREADCGVWEERDGRRHHTVSKALCWVALDRALRLAEQLGAAARPDAWRAGADEIRTTVLREAYDERRGALVGDLEGDELDAAVLLLPLTGFLDAGDERMRSTMAALEQTLMCDGLLRRLERQADEAPFVPVTFWLAACHALAGDPDTARRHFARAAATANDVGLLAEMCDPAQGVLLGGLPQSLSHVALITAARHITEAQSSQRP